MPSSNTMLAYKPQSSARKLCNRANRCRRGGSIGNSNRRGGIGALGERVDLREKLSAGDCAIAVCSDLLDFQRFRFRSFRFSFFQRDIP